MADFHQTPSLFPHMTFQNVGYILKCAAAFRVCPPSVLGWGRVFVKAVVTEMGKKRGGSGKKVIFAGKSEKLWEKKMHHVRSELMPTKPLA